MIFLALRMAQTPAAIQKNSVARLSLTPAPRQGSGVFAKHIVGLEEIGDLIWQCSVANQREKVSNCLGVKLSQPLGSYREYSGAIGIRLWVQVVIPFDFCMFHVGVCKNQIFFDKKVGWWNMDADIDCKVQE